MTTYKYDYGEKLIYKSEEYKACEHGFRRFNGALEQLSEEIHIDFLIETVKEALHIYFKRPDRAVFNLSIPPICWHKASIGDEYYNKQTDERREKLLNSLCNMIVKRIEPVL